MLYALKKGILYGPVNSRRLGKSLGVNLMPIDYKLCSFNCIYCHFGWTDKLTSDMSEFINDMPSLEEVVKAVEQAAKSDAVFNYITFSGNGEPTLYPHFPELIKEIIKIRDRLRPSVKLALLSNSTGLGYAHIRSVIPKIDVPVLKLDAGNEKKFELINRPAPEINFQDIVSHLAQLDNIYIQTIFLGGNPTNDTREDLLDYFEKIKYIRPKEVHIYSIDRPVPDTHIVLISPARLEEIAQQAEKETGVRFKAFYQAVIPR